MRPAGAPEALRRGGRQELGDASAPLPGRGSRVCAGSAVPAGTEMHGAAERGPSLLRVHP